MFAMQRRLAVLLSIAAIAGAAHAQQSKGPAMPALPAPIVFFDIAGPDTTAISNFYAKVFNWQFGPGGQFSVPVSGLNPGSMLGATLRKDPANKLVYLGVPDVAATLKLIVENGGTVVAPRFEVRGVVVLGLFTDPAGNSMGLVEFREGKAVIP
jgi:predicted enzyme related to lactoylglutathione lyase